MAWLLLLAAGVLEIVWAVSLKHAEGFARFWPSAMGISAATLSFVLLGISLRTLPVGTAYAVWVGIGVLGVAAVGMAVLGEGISPGRLGFLALITVGIVGLLVLDG
jgi:quaternary ammonium compound-resistance protein SugE